MISFLFFSCLAGVGDAGLQELSALTSLTALNLDSRLFTDVGMRHLKPLTNLVLLDLFAAKVSDIGCGYIRYRLLSCQLNCLLPKSLTLAVATSGTCLIWLQCFPVHCYYVHKDPYGLLWKDAERS